MKNLFLVLSVALFSIATSCSSEAKTENKVALEQKTDENAKPVANQQLTIEVMGMVCEMGCGGSIRKEMKATNGVTKCSFDFEDEREVNVATIDFDDSKITEEEIILALTTMNEHQFTVGKHAVEPLK
jgi:copper chaperone CopZ